MPLEVSIKKCLLWDNKLLSLLEILRGLGKLSTALLRQFFHFCFWKSLTARASVMNQLFQIPPDETGLIGAVTLSIRWFWMGDYAKVGFYSLYFNLSEIKNNSYLYTIWEIQRSFEPWDFNSFMLLRLCNTEGNSEFPKSKTGPILFEQMSEENLFQRRNAFCFCSVCTYFTAPSVLLFNAMKVQTHTCTLLFPQDLWCIGDAEQCWECTLLWQQASVSERVRGELVGVPVSFS